MYNTNFTLLNLNVAKKKKKKKGAFKNLLIFIFKKNQTNIVILKVILLSM